METIIDSVAEVAKYTFNDYVVNSSRFCVILREFNDGVKDVRPACNSSKQQFTYGLVAAEFYFSFQGKFRG